MKPIINYLRVFFVAVDKRILLAATCFIAVAIYINYHFRLNHNIGLLPDALEYASWYCVFLIAFLFGYFLQAAFTRSNIFRNKKFLALLFIAPAIFSWKMVFPIEFSFCTDVFKNDYWNDVVYWPFKVVCILVMLAVVHYIFDRNKPFYGVTFKDFNARPYIIMLMIMVPLIAAASTQHDFQNMYPRMHGVEYLMRPDKGWYKLLYELSYGTDFFTIELFFRGFLVLAFAKWVGKDAVIPMALFYCTIHFGKPLGECISSYFGGMILGVVILNNRTIFGGLIVHVGIAWMMELGGYLGNYFT